MSAERFAEAAAGSFGWLNDAACVHDPDLQDELQGFSSKPPSAEAQALCEQPCRVREQCLKHGYRIGADFGWFGGLAPSRRRKLGNAENALAWLLDQGRLLPKVSRDDV